MGGETGCVQEFGGAGPAWVVMSQASVLAWLAPGLWRRARRRGGARWGRGDVSWDGKVQGCGERCRGLWSQLQGEAGVACVALSQFLMLSRGLKFWKKAEDLGSPSPQGN